MKIKVSLQALYTMHTKLASFNRIPQTHYTNERKKNTHFSGAKTIKEKTRVTGMVSFYEYGHRLPLAVVGMSKQIHYFILITDGKSPLPYTSKNHGLIET